MNNYAHVDKQEQKRWLTLQKLEYNPKINVVFTKKNRHIDPENRLKGTEIDPVYRKDGLFNRK